MVREMGVCRFREFLNNLNSFLKYFSIFSFNKEAFDSKDTSKFHFSAAASSEISTAGRMVASSSGVKFSGYFVMKKEEKKLKVVSAQLSIHTFDI